MIFHRKNDVTISLCPVARNLLEIKCIFDVRSFEMLPSSVEFSFKSFVESEKPPICHHGATMCQKKIEYRRAHQQVILEVQGKFQPFRHYVLGCGPDTEIEKTKALRSIQAIMH